MAGPGSGTQPLDLTKQGLLDLPYSLPPPTPPLHKHAESQENDGQMGRLHKAVPTRGNLRERPGKHGQTGSCAWTRQCLRKWGGGLEH